MYISLQSKIDNLYLPEYNPTLEEIHNLLNECVNKKEFATTVFIYDKMKKIGLIPNNTTYKIIEKLHSKTIKDNNTIKLKDDGIKRLQPRRRIHKIIKGYHYTNNYKKALEHKDKVVTYLDSNPEIKLMRDRFKLAKNISQNCNLDVKIVRYIITNLKKTKFF